MAFDKNQMRGKIMRHLETALASADQTQDGKGADALDRRKAASVGPSSISNVRFAHAKGIPRCSLQFNHFWESFFVI